MRVRLAIARRKSFSQNGQWRDDGARVGLKNYHVALCCPTLSMLRALWLLLFAALGSFPAFAQGPLLPTQPWVLRDPGPFTPASADWNNGNTTVTNPTGGGTISVQHFGVVWYPSNGQGGVLPGPTPYPLIVFAHGRFHSAPFIGQNHKQATYLLQHLASWGFMVASVNLDVVGQFGSPPAIIQRGELINKTVQYFQGNATYNGFIDFSKILYIGHSRGGEGVFAAIQQNPAWLSSIRAVGAIAPTNFQVFGVAIPCFVIYGSQDGDVNNGWPIQLYDQTQSSASQSTILKGFRYIEGANHFYFTDSITFGAETNAQLSRAQHHEISRTLWATWAFAMLYSDRPSLVRIAGDMEIQWSAAFKLHRIFYHPRRITVDDFEQLPANTGRNTLGGINTLTGLVSPVENTLSTAIASSYFHKTRGMNARWATPSMYEADLGADLDVTGYNYVTANLLQRYQSASNPAGAAQRFHISVTDALGNQATLDNTDVAPWPYPFTAGANGPIKSVLKTFRFPLSAFTSANPSIQITSLRKVRLDFDITSTGEFAIDDVAITQ